MSIDAHFYHTCTIRRATRTFSGPYNQPTDVYANHLTGVRFRFVEQQESILNPVTLERATRTTYLALFRAGTDVRMDGPAGTGIVADQITAIQHQDGTTEAGTFTITSLVTRRGSGAARHLSATLEQVRT